MPEETVWTFIAVDDVTPVVDEMSASVDAAASSIAETSDRGLHLIAMVPAIMLRAQAFAGGVLREATSNLQ